MVGYSETELLQIRFEEITHPDDLKDNREYAERALAGEIDSYSMEKRYLHKDGHHVWGHLTVSLVRDQSGEPVYVGVIEDVTQRTLICVVREIPDVQVLSHLGVTFPAHTKQIQTDP